MLKLIKSVDDFAQPLTLNVQGQYGQATMIGGVCSIVVKILYFVIFVILFIQLVTLSNPTTSQSFTMFNLQH
jgi:hypothetical protein